MSEVAQTGSEHSSVGPHGPCSGPRCCRGGLLRAGQAELEQGREEEFRALINAVQSFAMLAHARAVAIRCGWLCNYV